jgi:hypothetical protein
MTRRECDTPPFVYRLSQVVKIQGRKKMKKAAAQHAAGNKLKKPKTTIYVHKVKCGVRVINEGWICYKID